MERRHAGMSEFQLEAHEPQTKNFSRNNVMGKRHGKDFYETPYSMTQQLLDAEPFGTYMLPVLEPAAGAGAIVRVLERNGLSVVSNDLHADGGKDFLLWPDSSAVAIITNPPYGLSIDFILKAKRVCLDKFAFLLPTDYLHGLDRFERVWQETEFPLARMLTFVRRPMLGEPLREDGTYGTGMQTYAWFVWDHAHKGAPEIGWINNQEFVRGAP
jgi:hypothetical protein